MISFSFEQEPISRMDAPPLITTISGGNLDKNERTLSKCKKVFPDKIKCSRLTKTDEIRPLARTD